MSRIQVQFPWQKRNGATTPWTRVTTPYAGNGKGFHVIPEIGEKVLVEFEGGNPEKPVVIGAMFHGQGKSVPDGAGNATTNANHTINAGSRKQKIPNDSGFFILDYLIEINSIYDTYKRNQYCYILLSK